MTISGLVFRAWGFRSLGFRGLGAKGLFTVLLITIIRSPIRPKKYNMGN